MAQKLYDLAVKTGEYQKNGETKPNWKNVGAMLQGDKGPYLVFDRTFNPAGVPNPEGRELLIISLFEPRDNQQGGYGGQQQRAPAQQAPMPADDFGDSEIPF